MPVIVGKYCHYILFNINTFTSSLICPPYFHFKMEFVVSFKTADYLTSDVTILE